MPADAEAERFLGEVERLALKMVPEPLRKMGRTGTPTRREYQFADAPGLRIVVGLDGGAIVVGISLDGAVGEKVYENLHGSRALLGETLGKGIEFKGKAAERWIGESIPATATDRRTTERVAARLATYILYFKPMMDDLGSRA